MIVFDIEKAYDSVWREGLMIKLYKMGTGGRMYKSVLDSLTNWTYCVNVGDVFLDDFDIVNGIPQSNAISPVLFNIMIHDAFENVGADIGSLVYADDGKEGKMLDISLRYIQSAIIKAERWSFEWGFKMSVDKSCYIFFPRKRTLDNVQPKLCGQNDERVIKFRVMV